MWLDVANSNGEDQGSVNLERIDRVRIEGQYNEFYSKVSITQGTTTKTVYINNSERQRLLFYLNSR